MMEGSIATHNGFITMTSPRTGQHRTVSIKTALRGRWKGRRVVALLRGPQNTQDYQPFGFMNPDGSIYVFESKRAPQLSFYEKLANMLMHPELFESKGVVYQFSVRCRHCNRELTDPVSIRLGIGPTCRGER